MDGVNKKAHSPLWDIERITIKFRQGTSPVRIAALIMDIGGRILTFVRLKEDVRDDGKVSGLAQKAQRRAIKS